MPRLGSACACGGAREARGRERHVQQAEARVALQGLPAEPAVEGDLEAAEAPPDPELLFTHAYVDPPESVRRG